MLKQGILNSEGEVVYPTKTTVWVDDGSGGGGSESNALTDEQLRASPVEVDVTFPVTQTVSGTVGVSGSVAVTGPLTNAQLTAVSGVIGAAAYADDTGAANGTLIALLKGIYVQNAQMITLLETIATNTTPVEPEV